MNAKAVIQSLRDSRPIRASRITERVAIPPDPFRGQVSCDGCYFTFFAATCAQFDEPVTFTDCKFDCLDFYATYFLKGLTLDGCVVSDRVVFQSGGHNDKDHPFTIIDTRFDSFVDFEDCWFTGPTRFENVIFTQGTNLLGNQNTPVAVSFDFVPELVNVEGTLNLNTYHSPRLND